MNSHFSHLIWLGAGTASEPANILNTAEKITLIEARETACELLRKQHTETNIDIKQQLVDVASEYSHFTEYNLAEYSAIAPATGLKALFPGLRKTGTEQLASTTITDAVVDLHLSGTNNLLIIDIPDSNLALLQALQQRDQISFFKNIHVHTALEPLYKDSSTRADVISFMQSTGYELLQENNQDPELPWLTFFVNPLWLTLQTTRQELATERQAKDNFAKELEKANLDLTAQQQAKDILTTELEKAKQNLTAQQQAKDILAQELEKIKQELTTQQKVKDHLATELEKSRQELATQKLAKDGLTKELEKLQKTEQDHTKETNKLQIDLEKISKHAASQADKVARQEKVNIDLIETNEQLQKRQQLLQLELIKAEAQISVIKDILLKL